MAHFTFLSIYVHTVWPRTTKFGTVTRVVDGRVSTGSCAISITRSRAPAPQILGELLHASARYGTQQPICARWSNWMRENIWQSRPCSHHWSKVLLRQMLTRDLFSVANLLVYRQITTRNPRAWPGKILSIYALKVRPCRNGHGSIYSNSTQSITQNFQPNPDVIARVPIPLGYDWRIKWLRMWHWQICWWHHNHGNRTQFLHFSYAWIFGQSHTLDSGKRYEN